MIKLASICAAAALAVVPLATQAQDRDGYRPDRDDSYPRTAMGRGYDGTRAHDDRYDRRGDAAHPRADRGQVYGYGDGIGRDGGRAFYDGGGGFRGGVAFGIGSGGYYPYGGYDAGAYPVDGYGADLAYSWPDEYGTYQPFAYDYSAPDDTYYAGPTYDRDDEGDAGAPADVGWSVGGPPADCGRWIWREGRGAYEWAPAPCP